ncbi:M15 family metallopeptidase [Fibrobacter sp. UWEL]|uniref:M15 family metallopeptidase n=1 Tax=Fibrobacter sp. UWEL TaxID=1896209 RepID=UPI0009139DF4|nr:M15 family metallopeptidase [Fibrobacter sp. UWEL]SHK68907.1 LD-carboxypeptidase LdcB, LAS superfamily [Fibrobacter sp. UWEL]
MMNAEICFGLRSVDSDEFVCIDGYVVDRAVVPAYIKLKESLAKDGFSLRLESAYRNFEKQLSIWNRKASGQLKLLDAAGIPMERPEDEEQLMYAILTWSALPGASRHHLGTDLDVVDGNACPAGYEVQLTPAECDGMFAPFHQRLTELMDADKAFGFSRVFVPGRGKIQPEKWHIAHLPTSRKYLENFSIEGLRKIYEQTDIACKSALLDNLDQLAKDFIYPYFI